MKTMNNKLDKLLSEQFADQKSKISEGDRDMYDRLLSILETEPEISLSFDFSAKLNKRMREDMMRTENYKFYLSTILIITICSIALISLMMIIDYNYKSTFLVAVLEYKWIYFFILAAIFVVQYVDQKTAKFVSGMIRPEF